MISMSQQQRKLLMVHMSRHIQDTPIQYKTWAKYAIRVELTEYEATELFLKGLETGEIVLNES